MSLRMPVCISSSSGVSLRGPADSHQCCLDAERSVGQCPRLSLRGHQQWSPHPGQHPPGQPCHRWCPGPHILCPLLHTSGEVNKYLQCQYWNVFEGCDKHVDIWQFHVQDGGIHSGESAIISPSPVIHSSLGDLDSEHVRVCDDFDSHCLRQISR